MVVLNAPPCFKMLSLYDMTHPPPQSPGWQRVALQEGQLLGQQLRSRARAWVYFTNSGASQCSILPKSFKNGCYTSLYLKWKDIAKHQNV